MQWQTVIGLEVHTQLLTQSKLFSGSSTQYGTEANTQASAIDLALPGTLPVLNAAVIEHAIKFGLSIDACICPAPIFERKNYFYPDLPKGYQISQLAAPIVQGGHLDIILDDQQTKRIRINRAHLEEDAGKSVHEGMGMHSGVDLNRAGTPLLEIVTEPDMHSAQEAVTYLKTLHHLVRYLNISDGNMQEGSFRCDINISLRPAGSTTLGTRSEIKNVNSFRFVERAIEFEVSRQQDLLNRGEVVLQETRQYDPDKNITRAMRTKETDVDYRYFPDPDLLPVMISEKTIETIKQSLPELPAAKQVRFLQDYQLPLDDTLRLIQDISVADFFEKTHKEDSSIPPKMIASWLLNDLPMLLQQKKQTLASCPVTPATFSQLLQRITDNTLSNTLAKTVLTYMCEQVSSPDEIIKQHQLQQVNDTDALETIIDEIISNNPTQWSEYCAGKEKLMSFFVGKVMQVTKGKANPQQINQLLKSKQ